LKWRMEARKDLGTVIHGAQTCVQIESREIPECTSVVYQVPRCPGSDGRKEVVGLVSRLVS
jgi:hypothetical protein